MTTSPGRPPALLRWARRTLLILIVATAIAAAPYLSLGPPTRARLYPQNELARFVPTLGHGIVQLAGEAFLLLLVAYVGRRWLRLRL